MRFSPLTLFNGGEQGAWYDPSDFSTLFQNSSGTTPVTAVDQPVGLILDKSKNLTLGNDIIANGDFSNGSTGWTLDTGITISGGQANFATTSNQQLQQVTTFTAGKTYKITLTVTAYTSGAPWVWLGQGTQVNIPNPSSLGLKTIYVTSGSGDSLLRVGAVFGTGATFSFDNISIKELAGNHAFQATNNARPVIKIDGTGKYYLLFDGGDDGLATNSVSFTGTNNISVFAGIRKLSDSARGMVVELSVTSASNNGTFGMTAPNAASATYAFESKGTSLTDAVGTPFAAPITSVLSGLAGISTDSNILRVNGVQADSDTGDQGTGNYGNYPLYIGRRGGSSLPFNGQLYSLIIVGKAVTATELANTETWINGQTGAYA